MSRLRSGCLAAWARAWLAGTVDLDQVIDAVTADDEPHLVAGLVEFGDVTLPDLLASWRRTDATVRVALPAAGDARGVPGPPALRAQAFTAGELVLVGRPGAPGTAFIPEIVEYHPSSRPTTVVWHTYATEPVPADHQSVADAQYELTTSIREAATMLAAADIAHWRDGFAEGLGDARRAGERLDLPPGHPTRAVALLAQAQRMQAVLDLAATDPIGSAVDRTGITDRAAALRPLAIAVRRARATAYNATAADV